MKLGTGIGWRPEIADAVERLPGVDWVEIVAENVCPGHLPDSLNRLRARGARVVPHGVSLGLGGADRPSEQRLKDLAERAVALDAPLVSEHIAFVRAGGVRTATPPLEAGHLLPVPRTRDALAVLCENVRIAQDSLPVPLALENIAALISWPDEELTEGQFLAELVERTGVRLLVDVANLHTNHVNRGEDPVKALDELPVEAIAYVHVAGGVERDGVWHDTHSHPVTEPVLAVLRELTSRISPPGVLLERDDDFPPADELAGELETVRAVLTSASPAPRRAGTTAEEDAAREGTAPLSAATAADSPEAAAAAGAPEAAAVAADTAPGAGQPGAAAAERAGGAPEGNGQRAGAAHAPETGARGAAPGGVPDGTDAPDSTDGPAIAPDGTAPDGAEAPASAPDGSGGTASGGSSDASTCAPARDRLGIAQAALLSALVAGTPAPEGFDRGRLRVQSHALAAKRSRVVAKLAPELPAILGDGYRPAFLAYARARPMHAGYRRDAMEFVEHLLLAGRPDDAEARARLSRWWQERAVPRPPRRTRRIVRAARAALVRRQR
ncbi:DUF692 family multinuclear iron-containing protein [Streptomyces sp. NPDC004609]|uniref:multinuclear nonheme iron-dependent oxidase n=1 Tax=Streptomyces sp. NPDC004609 TaxID=3364704 RepID=UPI00369151CA